MLFRAQHTSPLLLHSHSKRPAVHSASSPPSSRSMSVSQSSKPTPSTAGSSSPSGRSPRVVWIKRSTRTCCYLSIFRCRAVITACYHMYLRPPPESPRSMLMGPSCFDRSRHVISYIYRINGMCTINVSLGSSIAAARFRVVRPFLQSSSKSHKSGELSINRERRIHECDPR